VGGGGGGEGAGEGVADGGAAGAAAGPTSPEATALAVAAAAALPPRQRRPPQRSVSEIVGGGSLHLLVARGDGTPTGSDHTPSPALAGRPPHVLGGQRRRQQQQHFQLQQQLHQQSLLQAWVQAASGQLAGGHAAGSGSDLQSARSWPGAAPLPHAAAAAAPGSGAADALHHLLLPAGGGGSAHTAAAPVTVDHLLSGSAQQLAAFQHVFLPAAGVGAALPGLAGGGGFGIGGSRSDPGAEPAPGGGGGYYEAPAAAAAACSVFPALGDAVFVAAAPGGASGTGGLHYVSVPAAAGHMTGQLLVPQQHQQQHQQQPHPQVLFLQPQALAQPATSAACPAPALAAQQGYADLLAGLHAAAGAPGAFALAPACTAPQASLLLSGPFATHSAEAGATLSAPTLMTQPPAWAGSGASASGDAAAPPAAGDLVGALPLLPQQLGRRPARAGAAAGAHGLQGEAFDAYAALYTLGSLDAFGGLDMDTDTM
jgi:hypothetical protein